MKELICWFTGHDIVDASYWTKDNMVMRGQEMKHFILVDYCKRCGKGRLPQGSNTWQAN
jgi:hypothetical protein